MRRGAKLNIQNLKMKNKYRIPIKYWTFEEVVDEIIRLAKGNKRGEIIYEEFK